MSAQNKMQVTKEESIYKPFPQPTFNMTTMRCLEEGPRSKNPQPIHVYPNEVIFQGNASGRTRLDIAVGKGEEMTVLVKNATKNMKRIKIKPPATSKFFCDYKSTGPLAPGLSMELIVSFKATEEGGNNYSDEILIIPEGEKPIRLPLIAFMKAWHVVYPPFINFGFLQPSKPARREILFINEGNNTAAVTVGVAGNDPSVIVEEPAFEIRAGEKKAVGVNLTLQGSGELMSKSLNVSVGGEQREPISLNAVIVKQVLSVVFENGAGQSSEINFGSLFFGEVRDCNAVLVNNGPKPAPFNITFSNDSQKEKEGEGYGDDFKPPMRLGQEMMEREMSAVPLSGTVGPYSEVLQLPLRLGRCRSSSCVGRRRAPSSMSWSISAAAATISSLSTPAAKKLPLTTTSSLI